MHEIGGLTSANLKCYQTSARDVSTSVTRATESMGKFIERAQLLNSEMQDIELLYRQVLEIKQTLDLLESLVARLLQEKRSQASATSRTS